MEKTRYDPSVKLENELETDHYETAREVFERARNAKDALKESIRLFKNYDTIKAQVIDNMKEKGDDADYTEYVSGFTSDRAVEIIQAAFADHNKENTDEHGTTKSRGWRKA